MGRNGVFHISIVVPTHNRHRLLQRCLDSLHGQSYPRSRIEIVVVDDGSEDPTKEVVEDWILRHPEGPSLRYVAQPGRRGPAAARNAGILASRGEYVAFIDDDCVAEPDWLEELTAGMNGEDVGGVGGTVRLRVDGKVRLAGAYMLRHRWYERPKMVAGGPAYLLTGNCLYSRVTLEETGLFDEAFSPGEGGEDAELGRRVRARGFRLAFRPAAVTWHPLRTSLIDLLHTAYRYGVGAAKVAARHHENEPEVGPAPDAVPGPVRDGREPGWARRAALVLVDILVRLAARLGARVGSAHERAARGFLGLSSWVLRNLFAKAASEMAIKPIRLVMVILAARWLGRGGFGAYSYALALGYILVQFADMGLQFHLARQISRNPEDAGPTLARVIRSKLVLMTLVVPAFLGVGALTSRPADRWLIWILGAALLFNSFVELANYVFRGFQRLEYEARLNLLNVGLGTVAGLTAIRMGMGPLGLAFGCLLGSVVSFAMALRWVHGRFIPRSQWILRERAGWLAALRPSFPIGLAIVLSILYFRVDILFLEHYWDSETVGLYASAYRIVESFGFLPGIFLAAVFPAFSELTSRDATRLPGLLRASLLWLTTLSSAVALGLLLFGPAIIRFFYGAEYLPAVTPLRILSPGIVFIFVNYGLTHFLIALGQARFNAILGATCLTVNVIGNLLLIPRYGMTAAAATTLLTEAVLFAGAFPLVLRGVRQRSLR